MCCWFVRLLALWVCVRLEVRLWCRLVIGLWVLLMSVYMSGFFALLCGWFGCLICESWVGLIVCEPHI